VSGWCGGVREKEEGERKRDGKRGSEMEREEARWKERKRDGEGEEQRGGEEREYVMTGTVSFPGGGERIIN
jgi:hypothetical protein